MRDEVHNDARGRAKQSVTSNRFSGGQARTVHQAEVINLYGGPQPTTTDPDARRLALAAARQWPSQAPSWNSAGTSSLEGSIPRRSISSNQRSRRESRRRCPHQEQKSIPMLARRRRERSARTWLVVDQGGTTGSGSRAGITVRHGLRPGGREIRDPTPAPRTGPYGRYTYGVVVLSRTKPRRWRMGRLSSLASTWRYR